MRSCPRIVTNVALVFICLGLVGQTLAQGGTIMSALQSQPDRFSFVVKGLQEAGLGSLLESAGPFTIFAPTNAAFMAAQSSMMKLMGNPAESKRVMMNHVIQGSYPIPALISSGRLPTMGGGTNTFAAAGNSATVNGITIVPGSSIMADNGVIHVIDAVMLN